MAESRRRRDIKTAPAERFSWRDHRRFTSNVSVGEIQNVTGGAFRPERLRRISQVKTVDSSSSYDRTKVRLKLNPLDVEADANENTILQKKKKKNFQAIT